ncbi:MAG TPA: hypothetical protein VFU86_20265 [Terriglobales bacterium]|nr:hypothetical protein [Terriglobales bacterium]
MTAARAESVELEAVSLDGKTVPRRHFFLKTLDIAVLKFHYFPTACANKMIMMALMRHIVVLGLSAEVPGLGQTRFAEEIERAVNGREAQVRIFARQLMVHRFGRDVFLLQKGIEDQFTLSRKFELMLPEMFLQDPHFFDMFRHHDQIEPPGWGIKDETEQPVKSVSIEWLAISNSL